MRLRVLLALACAPIFVSGAQVPGDTASSSTTTLPFKASSGNVRYTIQGEFEGSVVRQNDGLAVTITHGSIANQFHLDSLHNPLWRDIRLQLLVAQPKGKTWAATAASAPVRVTDEFDEDTTLQIDTVRFLVPHVTPAMMSHAWFVIGILATPLEGSPLFSKPGDSSTKYACSAEFLDGSKRTGITIPFTSPLEC